MTYALTLEPMISMARIMIETTGTLPLATAIRALMLKSGESRGRCADGLRLAVYRQRVFTLRMPNGEWSICLKKGGAA